MLIQSREEIVVWGWRIDDDIEEVRGITPGESHLFVLLDGLLRVCQGAGHAEVSALNC